MKKLLLALLISFNCQATPTQEVYCLAKNIHNEARGESYLGKLAVAKVTVNRTKFFNLGICDIVYAPRQFSWTRNKHPLEPEQNDYMIAALALAGNHELNKFNALFYHNNKVHPHWKYKKLTQIGNHIFYEY